MSKILTVDFIGKTLREKFRREAFDESLAIRQLYTFPSSNFCAIWHTLCISHNYHNKVGFIPMTLIFVVENFHNY